MRQVRHLREGELCGHVGEKDLGGQGKQEQEGEECSRNPLRLKGVGVG